MGIYVNKEAKKRFLRYIKKENGHWLWTGSQTGGFSFRGKCVRARKFAAISFGNFELKMWDKLLPACGIKECVRPDHLEVEKSKTRKDATFYLDGIVYTRATNPVPQWLHWMR